MNSRDFVEFLMSYLDGDLEAEARSIFEEHLSACPCCVAYLETYKKAVELGRSQRRVVVVYFTGEHPPPPGAILCSRNVQ